jgi:hypothetical protein
MPVMVHIASGARAGRGAGGPRARQRLTGYIIYILTLQIKAEI